MAAGQSGDECNRSEISWVRESSRTGKHARGLTPDETQSIGVDC
jgi:hypothetical protein